MNISMKNLNVEKKVLVSSITAILYILLVLITCTCSGQKSTLEPLIIEKQIDSSLYSGKRVKLIADATECATLKIDDQDFHLWRQANWSIKLQYLPTLDSAYCPNRCRCQENVHG